MPTRGFLQLAKCLFFGGILAVSGSQYPHSWSHAHFNQSSTLPEELLLVVSVASGGRLTGVPATSSASSELTEEQKRLAKKFELDLSKGSSIQSLLDLAKLALISGNTNRAVALHEQALNKCPESARLRNDLAVAYLARGKQPLDTVMALDLLEQVIVQDSSIIEAKYNRAIALERLQLPRESLKAWLGYLKTGPDSLWSKKAQNHLERLRRQLVDGWSINRSYAEEMGRVQPRQLREIVLRSRQDARIYGEEILLSEWAEARVNGRLADAEVSLLAAKRIGDLIAASTGERLLLDAIETIMREESSNILPHGVRDLVKGHRDFKIGLDLYYGRKPSEALEAFERAEANLRRGGSPFQYWASFYAALCLYYGQGDKELTGKLRTLRDSVATKPYYSLISRIDWVSGLVKYEEGDFGAALKELL
ncbi:MAG TPA: hypothetical protein VLE27_06965, partial [Thermoanaerobaculia bacterium]|nr:hypothetical protein [Thermoanaerobaculia bacterium]